MSGAALLLPGCGCCGGWEPDGCDPFCNDDIPSSIILSVTDLVIGGTCSDKACLPTTNFDLTAPFDSLYDNVPGGFCRAIYKSAIDYYDPICSYRRVAQIDAYRLKTSSRLYQVHAQLIVRNSVGNPIGSAYVVWAGDWACGASGAYTQSPTEFTIPSGWGNGDLCTASGKIAISPVW